MKKLSAIALLLLAGCGTKTVDPCSGVAGACLTLQVDGSSGVSQVDSLSIVVNSYPAKISQPNKGQPTSLPIAVALIFDQLTSTNLNIGVTGSLRGLEVGYGATQTTLTAGAHETVHVKLTAGTITHDLAVDDLSIDDLASPADGSRKLDLNKAPSDLCTVLTVEDCDDSNPCTVDSVSSTDCGNTCVHTPQATAIGCVSAGLSGVCLGADCCTGCIQDGVCAPGSPAPTVCGTGGADCFDCTKNSAAATCNGGTCSGCDSSSCGARTCGTSSCGYNCGGCADQCIPGGTLNHFVCSAGGTCSQNGGTNCGLYTTCSDGHTCATTCGQDSDCVSSAFCNGSGKCAAKSGAGGSCSAEGAAQDHECVAGLHCTWYTDDDATGLRGVCAHNTCTGCATIGRTDYSTCSGGGMPILQDPRNACPKTDVCHVGCAGTIGGCNTGFDQVGNPLPCGATTCTNSTNTLSGSLCVKNGGTVSCVASQNISCSSSMDDGDELLCGCGCANAQQCNSDPQDCVPC